jgi:ABC-type branched-subunit amino acid transport system substrate-binding protein
MAPDGVFSAHDYLDAAGAAGDGSIISGGPQPDADFIAKFQAKYQRAPQTAFVLQAYDAATALIGAIDATATAGSDGSLHIDRARLADALRSKKSLGLTGALSFDAYGDRVGTTPAEVGLVLYKVADGRFDPLP